MREQDSGMRALVQLSNGVNGPKLQFRSLPAMVEGAIALETPFGPAEAAPAARYDRFELYEGQDVAENAPDSKGVSYRVVFTGGSNSLSRYAPVQLMGSRIGSVGEAKLEYSPATGKMSIRAVIVIEPSRIQLPIGEKWSDRRRQMDSMMRRLAAQGLRAALSSAPPVIGGHMVVLRTLPGKNGELIPGGIPEIPTSSGSDVSDIIGGRERCRDQGRRDAASSDSRRRVVLLADCSLTSGQPPAAILNSSEMIEMPL